MAVAIPGSTVLLVEDDPDIRECMQDILEVEGHKVLTAANGREGLAVLDRTGPPCLILLDLMMPVMDGHEFLRHLGEGRNLQHYPVLILSADNAIEKAALAPGVVGYLKKPFELKRVLDLVKEHAPA